MMNSHGQVVSYKEVLSKKFLGITTGMLSVFVVACAVEKPNSSEQSGFPQLPTRSRNVSTSRSCNDTDGCRFVITETLETPLASDAEYTSRCQQLADEQNQGQCGRPNFGGTNSFASSSGNSSATQCIFKKSSTNREPGTDNTGQILKTINLQSSAGGAIDVSTLCNKQGVSCKVTDDSCTGSIDIKIIDQTATALSSLQIAQICHAYTQPRATLPLRFSCSYGKAEDSQTTVVSGTYAKIVFNASAETGTGTGTGTGTTPTSTDAQSTTGP